MGQIVVLNCDFVVSQKRFGPHSSAKVLAITWKAGFTSGLLLYTGTEFKLGSIINTSLYVEIIFVIIGLYFTPRCLKILSLCS